MAALSVLAGLWEQPNYPRNKENAVYTYHGILFSLQKKEILEEVKVQALFHYPWNTLVTGGQTPHVTNSGHIHRDREQRVVTGAARTCPRHWVSSLS